MTTEWTIIKVPRETRQMLERVIEAWENAEVPRLQHSFPRTVELLCHLALANPPTAEELKAAGAKLQTKPRGRPRGLTKWYTCGLCNKRLVFDEIHTALADNKGVCRYACSAYCETKMREFYDSAPK